MEQMYRIKYLRDYEGKGTAKIPLPQVRDNKESADYFGRRWRLTLSKNKEIDTAIEKGPQPSV